MRRTIAVAVAGAVGFAAPAHADSGLPGESFDNLPLCDDTDTPEPTHGRGSLCFVPSEYGIGEWVMGDGGRYRSHISVIEHCEFEDSEPSSGMVACYWDAEYMGNSQGDPVMNYNSGETLRG